MATRALAEASASPRAAQLDALLAQIMQARLRARPELATELGLDTGPLAGQKRRLNDVSLRGSAEGQARPASALAPRSFPGPRRRPRPTAPSTSACPQPSRPMC